MIDEQSNANVIFTVMSSHEAAFLDYLVFHLARWLATRKLEILQNQVRPYSQQKDSELFVSYIKTIVKIAWNFTIKFINLLWLSHWKTECQNLILEKKTN